MEEKENENEEKEEKKNRKIILGGRGGGEKEVKNLGGSVKREVEKEAKKGSD